MLNRIADRGVEIKSDKLRGKHLGFGICGGIGAVETVKAIRELRRHGARVTAFFTSSVEDFITELSVEWACGEKVVKQLGADVGHLDDYDLVVVAPATLNTLAKVATGITDNPVTLLVAGQLGNKRPVVMAPTMNIALKHHPLYREHVARVTSWGVRVLESDEEEGRLKMPSPEKLSEAVIDAMKGSKSGA